MERERERGERERERERERGGGRGRSERFINNSTPASPLSFNLWPHMAEKFDRGGSNQQTGLLTQAVTQRRASGILFVSIPC